MSRLAERTAVRLSAALWSLTALIALAGAVLTVIAWGDLSLGDSVPNLVSGFSGMVYATLGALIVRRVRNPIGWILLGEGFGLAFLSFASGYAVVGILTHPGAFPDPRLVGTIAALSFIPTSIGLAFMLFVFPTGTLPSPRWRPIVTLGFLAMGLTLIGSAFNPRVNGIPAPGGTSLRLPNPLGIASLRHAISTFLVYTTWALVIAIAAAFLALVVRYRSGTRELRQQVKWVAFAAALALLSNFVALLALFVCHCDSSPVAGAMFYFVAFIVFFGIPAAFTIAILKYGLYQIDLIINRTLVYGLLAAALTAVYVAVVAGVGTLVGRRGSSLLTVAAAVAIALLFQPVRRRAQLVANRLVYGERATPYQVLSDFAERMAGTYGIEDVLQRMASILADGTGATRVDVWLRVGSELRPVATWPDGAAAPEPMPLPAEDDLPQFGDATRAVGVRHGEELLGALALEKPRNEPLSPTEDKLLQDLAAQAGLVLRNVRLTAELQANVEELRASRRRLVEAQDQERRKIERNLHDGAQQQLVALTVQLGLLERLAEDPLKVKEMAARLQGALRDALDDLRDLARGIYPPLLADKGLAAALETQARKAVVATTVEPDGVGRYPQEIEAAVYFCALEALQNVAKYAEASSAIVRLSERDGALVFEIQDDGHGFDPGRTSYGTGLQGMADRLDSIGGELDITSTPGSGTTVRGSIRLG
jgi:signal transduction histidine kinase